MDEDTREKAELGLCYLCEVPGPCTCTHARMHTRAGTCMYTAHPGTHALVLAVSACRPLLSGSQFSSVTQRLESVFAQPPPALSGFFPGQSWFWP